MADAVPDYIAFLRAVNLGTKRKLPMADLRASLERAGFDAVETYIQTGNVRLTAPMESGDEVERHLEAVLGAAAGFEVPAVLFTPPELSRLHDQAMRLPSPFGQAQGHGRYLVLYKEVDLPDAEAVAAIEAWDRPGELATVLPRSVHVWLDHPTMQAGFFGAFKKVLEPGTNRNLRVVTTLVERWVG